MLSPVDEKSCSFAVHSSVIVGKPTMVNKFDPKNFLLIKFIQIRTISQISPMFSLVDLDSILPSISLLS